MSDKSTKEIINVVISSDGKVTVQVQGVSGPSCTDLTKFLEESLGQVSDLQYTSDYYKETRTLSSTRIRK